MPDFRDAMACFSIKGECVIWLFFKVDAASRKKLKCLNSDVYLHFGENYAILVWMQDEICVLVCEIGKKCRIKCRVEFYWLQRFFLAVPNQCSYRGMKEDRTWHLVWIIIRRRIFIWFLSSFGRIRNRWRENV